MAQGTCICNKTIKKTVEWTYRFHPIFHNFCRQTSKNVKKWKNCFCSYVIGIFTHKKTQLENMRSSNGKTM